MIRPTMSHAVDKQHLHELISVYATNLESKVAELEEELKFLYEVACEGTNPEWLQEQINALKEQVK